MQRHRGILATLTLLALVVGGGAVGCYFGFAHLPHPRHASTRQLRRWMVQRDLKAEPHDVQLALSDRLEQELKNGLRVDEEAAKLTKAQQQQLRANFQQLKFVWFVSRSNQYFEQPLDQRFAFLERQTEIIHRLTKLHAGIQADESPNGEMAAFFDDIDSWTNRADEASRQRMRQAVHDGVICWLATGDMQTQTRETRRELANRIAAALDDGAQADVEQRFSLSQQQRATLRGNAVVLFEAWFQDRAKEYEAISAENRDAFVAEQVQRVDRWGILDFLMKSDATSQKPSNFAKMIGLSKLANGWIERASDEDRLRMRELFAHVQRQLLSGNVRL